MKKYFSVIKRSVCLLLCAVFAITALASCSGNTESLAIYGTSEDGSINANAKMTEGMFRLYVSQQKGKYLPVLAMNYGYDSDDNLDELWIMKAPDGKTYDEHFNGVIIDDAKRMVAANVMLYENFEIPQGYVDQITATVENYAVSTYGSVMEFEEYLALFEASYEDYKNLYLMTWNVDFLKEGLFAEGNGAMDIPDDAKKQYYAENCYTVEHITVNTSYKSKIDGTKAPLEESETEKRKLLANEIFEQVKNGATIAEIDYNFKNEGVTVYPKATSVDINGESAAAPELTEALRQMEIGETRTVTTSTEVHILRRIETDPEKYANDATLLSNIRTKIVNIAFEEYLDAYCEKVTVNTEVTSKYPLRSAIAA